MRQWLGSIKLFLALLIIMALVYPLLVTGLAQLLFPYQAQGSLIRVGQNVIGSSLLGQSFVQDKYFHGRPSQTQYQNDIQAANQVLLPGSMALQQFKTSIRQQFPSYLNTIPEDLMVPSASMLDPHLSKASILIQVPRVAKARKINPVWLAHYVELYMHKHWMTGALVNVLALNVALDQEVFK